MSKKYVQYGCGLSAPENWENFDASPSLRIQKTPIVGSLLRSRLDAIFPDNVKYGDIIKGLPVPDNSCDGVYCSHTLEHLPLEGFRKALVNTYKILKPGGIFRCVLPDIEYEARAYLKALEGGDDMASLDFIGKGTLLGVKKRGGAKDFFKILFGNARHLWMWDHYSLTKELEKVGFKQVKRCKFNDCEDEAFKLVEDEERFQRAVALQCTK